MKNISEALPKITVPRKRHLQLVKLAGDLAETSIDEADSLGFMSRLLGFICTKVRKVPQDLEELVDLAG